MLQVNVVHANTHRDLVCSCRVAMRGIPRVCEVIIKLYRISYIMISDIILYYCDYDMSFSYHNILPFSKPILGMYNHVHNVMLLVSVSILSLSTVVLNSKDWSEIIWLPEKSTLQ